MKIMTAEQEMNAWKKKQQRGPSKRDLVRMTDQYEGVNENTIALHQSSVDGASVSSHLVELMTGNSTDKS